MKKLLSLVLAMVMLMCFSACDPSEDIHFTEILTDLLDGYPKALMGEILHEPMVIGKNAEVIGDGSMVVTTEEQTRMWQEKLDKEYEGIVEPGTVVDIYFGTDLMHLWVEATTYGADYKLKELKVECLSDTNASYEAVLTFTLEDGSTANAAISGSVQLSENGLANYLTIQSFDEVYKVLGLDHLIK